ncbi:outer membrane protein assembly factor BamE domain-containing protein [Brevundimonas variabilis]|uniref:Outer membrane protein assembly factor BamE (Lipoprotein component of BamABCDE complex) n=1 Tax=Brevundimonas variabilis TaxID=74312 RepID=A0A7W9CH19_9CAUL|nr:outer membrane protein assembly factor BamE [Brevundimonas variabilis]MBB5745508.1 outer membrane protein assembly factor BamE (lipoprotein component of BamABCDE complex) [Brevundimonas variabilis]
MPRISPLIAAAALAIAAGACAPTIGINGFQSVDVKPADIVAGTDTRTTVLARLGTPSATSTFEDNIWYYIGQTTEKYTYNNAQVSQRSVTAITFDEAGDKVTEVKTLGLEDGQQVAMNSRETPTRGRQLTIIEQLLGNVARGQLPRTEEDVPGQRRPD